MLGSWSGSAAVTVAGPSTQPTPHRPTMQRLDSISPVRVFLVVLAVVFVVEATIMLAVEWFDALPQGGPLVSLIDALVLVLVLCPVLWLLVVRPLRGAVEMRGSFLSRVLAAQEEERARIGRDLHDELGQLQTAVLLGAQSIRTAGDLSEARRRSEEVARMASAAIEASRRLARGIVPGALADLGLGVAADRLCEDLSTSGLTIERSIAVGDRRFAPEVEIAAYRVLQEALTNVVRHSGAARAWISIDADDRALSLEVHDDGVGIPSGVVGGGASPAERPADGSRSGMGIAGMRERILLLDGSFDVASPPRGGTTIRVRIPLVGTGVRS